MGASRILSDADPVSVLTMENVGRRWRLFRLAFGQTLLVVLTLGIYRFWAITRLRRFLWSSVAVGRDPFSYHGTGLEKLLGFLIAIVVLAIVLGLAQLLVTFLSFVFGEGLITALPIPLLIALPLLFFAQYRARRYVLSRTRWRGIRFALESGSGGYVLRSMGYGLLTIATLGLLVPLGQMQLEKYLTGRTRYGDLALAQAGDWRQLMQVWVVVWLAIVTTTGGAIGALFTTGLSGIFIGLTVAGILAWAIGLIVYSIHAFVYLTNNKSISDNAKIQTEMRFRPVVFVGLKYIGAITIVNILSIVVTSLFMIVGAFIGIALAPWIGLNPEVVAPILDPNNDVGIDTPQMASIALFIWIGLIFSVVFIVPFYSATGYAFWTWPLMSLVCIKTVVQSPAALEAAQQRARERSGEAGGFADALGTDIAM